MSMLRSGCLCSAVGIIKHVYKVEYAFIGEQFHDRKHLDFIRTDTLTYGRHFENFTPAFTVDIVPVTS